MTETLAKWNAFILEQLGWPSNKWNNPTVKPGFAGEGYETKVVCVVCESEITFGKSVGGSVAPYFCCSSCSKVLPEDWCDVLKNLADKYSETDLINKITGIIEDKSRLKSLFRFVGRKSWQTIAGWVDYSR